MANAAAEQSTSPRSDVFISYSRKDRDFVKRLEKELENRGRATWVDWEGIRPAEEFMQAIFPAIEGTDTFIFVLSPDSVTSEICGKELAHAVSHNKRMIPIMARETDAKAVPEALAKLNWVFARDADSFEAAANFLISALDTDLGWVRAHTRLLTRALEWQGKAKSNSFVLRGEDLRAAEQWLAQAGTEKERQPTALQTEYIIASRKAASRRQRITLGAVSFGLVLAIVLSILFWVQREEAKTQRSKAVDEEARAKRETSQSEFLRASAAWDAQDSTEALLGLAKALEWNPANTEAATALINLLGQRQWPHRVASRSLLFPINHLLPTPDGRRIIVAGDQTDGGLWAAERAAEDSGIPLTRLAPARISVLDGSTLEGSDPIPVLEADSFERVIVNEAADRILVRDGGTPAIAGNTFLIDTDSRRVLKRWTHALTETSDEWFSPDGKWAMMWNQRPTAAGATPQHWVEIVSAADAAPHATLPRIPLPGAPVAAIMLENEVRLVHGDGRVVAQTLGNSKSDAAHTLLTVKDIADLKAVQFAPDGRSFVAAKEGAVTLREIPEPQKQKTTPKPVPDAFEIPIAILNREFSHYRIGAVFRGPDEVTFQADFYLSGEALSHVWRMRRDAGADLQVVAQRTGGVAPLSVLPTGIVYGADSTGTMAFIEPFDGGAFSGTFRHAGQIKALCAMGGNALATASDDGEVKLWRFSAPALAPSLNQLPAPEGAAPNSPAPRLLARNREHATRPVELWAEKINPPPPAGSEPDADNSEPERLILVQNGERHAVDLGDSDRAAKTIEGAELSSDGRRAVFYGQMRRPVDEIDPFSGAWVFQTDKPDQVFPVTPECTWAGFAPDGKVLIILRDRLCFWDDAPAADGGRDFKPTGRVVPVNSQSAVFSANGERLATWSTDEVLVWDTGTWKPLHRFQAAPGWKMSSHAVNCAPALSDDGRRLATAYDRVFVIWDVASAKRLSDPIDCKASITSLAFTGAGSTQVDATVENGTERSVITWNYAHVTDTRDGKGVKELSELAKTVAVGDWVTKAPGLVAGKDCPKIIAALLEHFAAQARAIREKGVTPAPSAPK